MLLDNKSAVVCGGGGSIGGAVARAFAREGASVFPRRPHPGDARRGRGCRPLRRGRGRDRGGRRARRGSGEDDIHQVFLSRHLRHERIRPSIARFLDKPHVFDPVRTTMRAVERRPRRRRVASAPSMSGICKSMRITSGLREAAIVKASRP
jgi:hypothetical protein